MKRFLLACFLLSIGCGAQAALVEQVVNYGTDTTRMQGYLVYDDAIKGKRPGVLVVHEWWGHNDYARERARMLAKLGYTALALDMYGEGKKADHPDDAMKFMQESIKSSAEAKARFMAAYNLLKNSPTTDSNKMAAIGYCFGGGVVLTMARAGVDLDAVVSFHGSIDPIAGKAEPGKVKAKILVFNGAEDPFVKPESITAFKQEMKSAGVDYRFVSLPGAKHSFTNPQADEFGRRFNMPLAYNIDADETSWRGMRALFDEVFSK